MICHFRLQKRERNSNNFKNFIDNKIIKYMMESEDFLRTVNFLLKAEEVAKKLSATFVFLRYQK